MSFWKFFRIIFVIFSLYLLGDAFYRWDGFRMYASFSEFLPAIALTTILSIIPLIILTILVWILLLTFEWFCSRIKLKIKIEHVMLYAGIFIIIGALTWKGKRLFLPYAQTTLQTKVVVFICVTLLSMFLMWLFRNKTERWISVVQERITPIVWLFGIWVLISVPLVAYYTWFKEPPKAVSHKFASSVVGKDRPNIILVTFDALTARNMSLYGYYRETTPFISKWAKNASIFTRVEAASNETAPTTASLMTSKRIWTHQRYHWDGKAYRVDIENMPLLLKNNGYYNMAFIVNPVTSVKRIGISTYFDIVPKPESLSVPRDFFNIVVKLTYQLFEGKIVFHDWALRGDFLWGKIFRKINNDSFKTPYPPKRAFKEFLEVVDNNPPEPYFAWIHLFPPHDPYLPSEPYKGMFNTSTELRSLKTQTELVWDYFYPQVWSFQLLPHEIKRKLELMRDYYDEFIRDCDKQFEDFINELERRNTLKNTVIILSSDHGESFEHDYPNHGGLRLYEQVTHIPLIIKEPNQARGRIIDDLVTQIDIPATILDLANISVPSWLEGQSLEPLMHGKSLARRTAFSMSLAKNTRGHQITKGTIAVWEGDYKLIHYLEKKESLLFNLKQDPGELNNLFDKEPEVGQRLLGLIKENLKKANERIAQSISHTEASIHD